MGAASGASIEAVALVAGVVDQIAEIIGEAGEQANFGSHDISMRK